MGLISKQDANFADVAKLLATDAALSAEVLRMANSPLGGRYGAKTIIQALSLLGITRVAGLVLTLGVSKLLAKAGKTEVVRRCWRHNLATALAAKELSRSFYVDTDQAYTAGLLHEVGRLVLIAGAPADYERLVAGGGDIREAERERFGVDHAQAGALLIQSWNLPSIYIDVVRSHSAPLGDSSELTNLAHVACEVVGQMGFTVAEPLAHPKEISVSDELTASIAVAINALECEFGL